MMADTKKIPLTGAQRQSRYAAKLKLSRDAERRAFYLAQTALLLERYRAALSAELRINPHGRAAILFARRAQELTAEIVMHPGPAGGGAEVKFRLGYRPR